MLYTRMLEQNGEKPDLNMDAPTAAAGLFLRLGLKQPQFVTEAVNQNRGVMRGENALREAGGVDEANPLAAYGQWIGQGLQFQPADAVVREGITDASTPSIPNGSPQSGEQRRVTELTGKELANPKYDQNDWARGAKSAAEATVSTLTAGFVRPHWGGGYEPSVVTAELGTMPLSFALGGEALAPLRGAAEAGNLGRIGRIVTTAAKLNEALPAPVRNAALNVGINAGYGAAGALGEQVGTADTLPDTWWMVPELAGAHSREEASRIWRAGAWQRFRENQVNTAPGLALAGVGSGLAGNALGRMAPRMSPVAQKIANAGIGATSNIAQDVAMHGGNLNLPTAAFMGALGVSHGMGSAPARPQDPVPIMEGTPGIGGRVDLPGNRAASAFAGEGIPRLVLPEGPVEAPQYPRGIDTTRVPVVKEQRPVAEPFRAYRVVTKDYKSGTVIAERGGKAVVLIDGRDVPTTFNKSGLRPLAGEDNMRATVYATGEGGVVVGRDATGYRILIDGETTPRSFKRKAVSVEVTEPVAPVEPYTPEVPDAPMAPEAPPEAPRVATPKPPAATGTPKRAVLTRGSMAGQSVEVLQQIGDSYRVRYPSGVVRTLAGDLLSFPSSEGVAPVAPTPEEPAATPEPFSLTPRSTIEVAGKTEADAVAEGYATHKGREYPAREMPDGSVILDTSFRNRAGRLTVPAEDVTWRTKTPREGMSTPDAPVDMDERAPIRMVTGKTDRARTVPGSEVPVTYALVEASDLVPSHRVDENFTPNPDHPVGVQGRERDAHAAQGQVRAIGANPDPRRLGDGQGMVTSGAPIIEGTGVVVAGNGRAMGLQLAYKNGTAEGYRSHLRDNAAQYGLDPAAIDGMREPVLVRKGSFESPAARQKFAMESDVPETMGKAARELVVSDALRLTPTMLDSMVPRDDGNLNTSENAAFRKAFVEGLTNEERQVLLQSDGNLSIAGEQRLKAALLQKAYDAPDLVTALFEDSSSGGRQVLNAMLAVAPRIAKQRARIEAGTLHAVDVSRDLTESARTFLRLQREGRSVQDFLDQPDLLTVGDSLSPNARKLLAFFDKNRRSGVRIREGLNTVLDRIDAMGHPQQKGMFGEESAEVPTTDQVIERGLSAAEQSRAAEASGDLGLGNGRLAFPSGKYGGKASPDAPVAESRPKAAVAESPAPVAETSTPGATARETGAVSQEPAKAKGDTKEPQPVEGVPGLTVAKRGGKNVFTASDGKEFSGPSSKALATKYQAKINGGDAPIRTEVAPVEGVPEQQWHEVYVDGYGSEKNLHATPNEAFWDWYKRNGKAGLDAHGIWLKKFGGEWYIGKALLPDGLSRAKVKGKNVFTASDGKTFIGDDSKQKAIDYQKGLGVDRVTSEATPAKPQEPAVAEKTAEPTGSGTLQSTVIPGGKEFVEQDVVPAVRVAARGAAKVIDDVQRVLLPASRGETAGETARVLRANLGLLAQKSAQAHEALRTFVKAMDRLPVKQRWKFADDIEAGRPQSDPALEPIAKLVRQMLDERRVAVQATGKMQSFIEDYFPHIWAEPEQAGGIIARIFGKRPLEGSKSFLKKRTIPTIKEGMDAGLVPITSNPVDMVLMKIHEMDRFLMGHDVIQELKDKKLIKFVRATEKTPDGYTAINDKFATVHGPLTDEGAITIRGRYVAPDEVATVLNNHLSPGLQGNPVYSTIRQAGNVMNQAQLGMSAFHAGFTTFDAMVSTVAIGVKKMAAGGGLTALSARELMRGNLNASRALGARARYYFAQALKDFALGATPIGAVVNVRRGMAVRKAYLGLSPNTPYGEVVTAIVQGGGRINMDNFYRTGAAKGFMDAIKAGNYPGALIRSPFAAIEAMSAPIMEYLVPLQKLGVASEMAQYEIDRMKDRGVDVTPENMREAMGKAWDSVDNRMGQLVYDNLFWNRTLKDALMASVRSVGWNLGTIRELGGAVVDVPTQAVQGVRGKLAGKDLVTHRMAYAMALPFMAAVYGAIYQYLRTGKGPEELKDYYFPKNGLTGKDGRPERVSMPTYMKDVYAYSQDPVKTVGHKVHPLIGTTIDMLQNEDYYGTEVRNADDPAVQQLTDVAAYMAKQFVPFSIRNASKERGEGGNTGQVVEGFFGIVAAPGSVTQTEAMKLAYEEMRKKLPAGSTTQEQYEQREENKKLVDGLRSGDSETKKAIDAMKASGEITARQRNLLVKKGGMSALNYTVSRLSAEAALRVYAKATPAERTDKLKEIIGGKIARADRTPSQRAALEKQRDLLGIPEVAAKTPRPRGWKGQWPPDSTKPPRPSGWKGKWPPEE